MVDKTWSLLCFLAFFIASFETSLGNDPFEGNFPLLNCTKPRPITGCNESFWDAYERTNASKSDPKGNRPTTGFYLYTRRNRVCPEYLHTCGGRLPENTNFRTEQETILIVGGYISTICVMAYFRELKDQLLYRDDYNVILIDWPWGNYYDIALSIRNAVVVGKQMAFFIKSIVYLYGISELKFHVIGHSIGAHIAGFCGSYFIEFTGKKLRRISGLDPAGSVFVHASPANRLDPSDAILVIVIHTSAGDCLPFAIGSITPSGTADFYVNGGNWQPSCFPDTFFAYLKGDVFTATASLYTPLCFHFQAIRYFQASINACHCQFIGVECDNYKDFLSGKCRSCGADGSRCAVMGMDWEYYPRKPGNTIYYLKIKKLCPYCDNSLIDLQGFPSSPVPEGKQQNCFVPSTAHQPETCS